MGFFLFRLLRNFILTYHCLRWFHLHYFYYDIVIMSHSLLWRHIVLLTVGVYSSNHRVLYNTIGISMTKRFQKKCRSVRPSVCPFVTLTKKAYSSFIIDGRKIIRISDKRVWHPLQENEAIFSEKYFSKILERIFQNFALAYSSFIINSRIIIRISDERIWLPLQENVAIFSKK